MSRMKASLIALLLVFTGISMCANDNVAYAVDTPYMDADGGFISEQMTVTKGIIPTATTEGYEDWLFAGWYTDNVCTKANVIKKAKIDEHNGKSAYAKFVPSEVLTVKVQVSEGTKDSGSTNMRFVSSIDTLNYAGVGIRVEYHGASGVVTKTFAGTKVFSKIIASAESGVDYNYNPKVFDTESAWFITGTVTNIPSEKYTDNFVVKPYWVTFDGTYVYGESRYVQVQDAYNDVVNVPVKADSQTTMDGLAIAGESVNERRYYTGEKYGALMISKSRSALPSLTSYEVKSGNNLMQTATYRNLESALGELTNHIPSGDTSWYQAIESEKEFVIVTAADLYGLAELVNGNTQSFQDKTIYLGANITVNEEGSASYGWNPIGDSYSFQGTFDGCKCVISGVRTENNARYLGLFGIMDTNSKVQNLRLINSTFVQTSTGVTGSIVGECNGTLNNVYSDADVTTSYRYAGGLIGRANDSSLKNCWYDGSVSLLGDALYGGGMVSVLARGTCAIENCLFTGSIHSEQPEKHVYAFVGGMCGGVEEEATAVNMESCVSTGDIVTSNTDFGAGAFVGCIKGSQTVTMSNVFASKDAGYTEVGAKGAATVSGQVVWTTNSDRLIGYCKEDTLAGVYEGASLDFATDWVVRDCGVPIPATFADVSSKVSVASGSTLDATLKQSIGLDKWTSFGGKALTDAVHYGAGKYVLTFGTSATDSKSTYEEYVSYLVKSVADGGLGFTEHQTNTMDALTHGIYTKNAGDWVLEVLHLDETGETSITIRTGVKELLSPNLSKDYTIAEGSGKVTLSMLTLTGTPAIAEAGLSGVTEGDIVYYFGNSFVFQLPNGHFIVNDGGSSGDFEGLIQYLKILAGKNMSGEQNPVYIDAWTISHHHGDHFGVSKGFYSSIDAMDGVTVDAFYVNEPNNRAFDYISQDDSGVYTKESIETKLHYRGIRTVRTSDGECTPIYSYQTGERYYFNGLTMDVIQSQEQIPVDGYAKASRYAEEGTDFNTTSTVLLFTTADGQTVMLAGDANYVNMNYIMAAYGKEPNQLVDDGIDVFQVWHHGKNTSNALGYDAGVSSAAEINKFTNYLTGTATKKFDVALFPCSVVYGKLNETDWGSFPDAWDANNYIINSCLNSNGGYYTYETDTTKVVRVEFDGQGGLTHGRYDILTTEDKEESGTITPGSPDQNIPGLWD